MRSRNDIGPWSTTQVGPGLGNACVGWTYWGYGRIVGINPLVVDFGIMQLRAGLCRRRPSLVPYVTVTGTKDGATASGGRSCCLL